MSKQQQITVQELREAARGRWIEIVQHLAPELSDAVRSIGSTRHHYCPRHHGEHGDAFRLYPDFNQTGGGVCNQCGSSPDGLALLIWCKGWLFDHAAAQVAEVLGFELVERRRGRPPKSTSPAPTPTLPVNRVFNPPAAAASSQPSTEVQPDVTKEIMLMRGKLAQRWQQATLDRGRLLEYLRHRGIAMITVPPSLRLMDWLPYYSEDPSGALTPAGAYPAMIAQVMHPSLGFVAIHRTWLSAAHPGKADVAPAKKLSAPLFDGATRGAAIRLFPASGDTLAIAEGIETALAVYAAISIPVWSTISAGGMSTVELPASARNVEIWADPGAAGQDAAAAAAERFTHEGRSVKIITPASDTEDWLDVLVRVGAAELQNARERAQPINPLDLPPPEIVIRTAEHEVGDEAVLALARDQSIYQRSGMLVHIIRESADRRGIVRPPNAPRIAQLPLPKLRERLTAVARWVRLTNDGKEPSHPPQWAIQAVAARGEWPGVAHLEGVAETPVLSIDGDIVAENGYHARTGLKIELNGKFPPVPRNPTAEDISRCVEELLDVVVDFPFGAPFHRSAWVAALLTPLSRFAFHGPSPLFLVDANTPGAGKGLLCDLIGLIVSGREMTRSPNLEDDAEMRKRITAIALSGDSIVLIDNIGDFLGTPSLDAALTASTWTDRILGKSENTQSLPLLATWYATGNNVILKGDIGRRILHVRIDTPYEKPEERDGFKHPEIKQWVLKERPRLITAALTILRGYCAAGMPTAKLKTWGSFDGWSRLVRQAVVWAGLPDPAEAREELSTDNDSETHFLRNLIAGIEEIDTFGRGIEVSEIIRQLNFPRPDGIPDSLKCLREAISELNRGGKPPSARSIGMKLHHVKGRVLNGKCLRSMFNSEHTKIWYVQDVSGTNGTTGTILQSSNESENENDLPLLNENIEGAGNTPRTPFSPGNDSQTQTIEVEI